MMIELKQRVVSTLEAIASVKEVVDAPSTDFTAFPAATVAMRGGRTDRLDTHRNDKETRFEVKLWTDPAQGRPASEDDLIAIIDEVTAAFENDRCFGGLATMRTVEWEKSTQTGTGSFDFATITLTIKSTTLIT
ncbi:MAG: hypothetical protein M0R37_13615 [Bacteroidales bacterium]|nr:hypothetical protein [Bacteroidales bacterium]